MDFRRKSIYNLINIFFSFEVTFIKDLNKSGALEGLINAKISEVDGLNIPEGAMVFQPQLIPALVNVTRRYGTERSTDLIEEGTGVWLYLNTSSGEPWSRRLLTERKAGLP